MFLGGNDTLTTQEKSYIQQFKDKAKEFWNLWNNLDERRDTVSKAPPAVQAEYAQLMDEGEGIRDTIQTVTSAIDKAAAAYQSVRDWISSTFGGWGFSGLNSGAIDQQAAQLGVIPLIPIAVIVVGVAAMGKWIVDAYTLKSKLDKLDELQKQGYTADQAANVIAKMGPPGLFAGAGTAIPIALIGVGALLYFSKR